ncbi:MAG: NRDE family protein [Brumimicrobium sp.]
MCTVTFVPLPKDEFVLTSNRDELPSRKTIFPEVYQDEEVKLLFPKDEVAGGTWIGASSKKRMLSLMNGGFFPHKRKEKYRLSRGIVVLNLLKTDDIEEHIHSFNFSDIESFTIILFENIDDPKLYQIVWDEERIHFKNLPIAPQIWSSAPLYSPEMHNERRKWFKRLKESNNIKREDIWTFHHEAGNDDKEVGLIMDRGFIKTKSVTQYLFNTDGIKVYYHDLQTEELSEKSM